MAIVKMSSFNLLFLKKDKEHVLQELQRFGNVQFKDLQPKEEDFLIKNNKVNVEHLVKRQEILTEYLKEIESYEKSKRKELSARKRRKQILGDIGTTSLTFNELEQKARGIDIESIIESMDEKQALYEIGHNAKIMLEIMPWEENKLKDRLLIEIRDANPIIGTISAEDVEEFTAEIKENGGVYAVAIKEKDNKILFLLKSTVENRENLKILCEKYHLKRRSADSVKMNRELESLNIKINKMMDRRNRVDGSLETLSNRKYDLMIYIEYLNNLILREEEGTKFLYSDSMVMIEGWIPTCYEEDFKALIHNTCKNTHLLNIEESNKNSEDTPVQIKNNKFTSAFEGITKMYAIPRYDEIDPTPVFAPFYLLFFGMMLGDIGYGLLMFIVMFIALKVIKFNPNTEKMVRFLMYLGLPTMLWGYIYGSFFGSLIPMTPIIDANSEYNRVLIMAITFGVIHLIVALGVKAYMLIRDGHIMHAVFDVLFWYMTLLGAIALLVKGFVPALLGYGNIFIGMMVVGMIGIVLTNGRDAKTFFGKFASGLYSLYGLTNYVSDIVSYSRLMALGLAGGSIGIAINMIVDMVSASGIIGIIFGAIIFIGGHMFNLFISGLSSYVHSSRLIYVEFFSKFYTGGGSQFVPFRAKSTYINIV